ncbi:UNVERIFIED_CONTAM: putative amidohydrolase [Brevibacillus sp. OAP136]
MMKVKVAAVQYAFKNIETPSQFVEQVTQYVELAALHQPQFLLFPELSSAQLLSIAKKEPYEAIRELDSYTELYVDLFSGLSKKHGMHIIGGSHVTKNEQGEFVNRAYLFYPDGTHAFQDKIHLTPCEKHPWQLSAGKELKVFETEYTKVAILTCYDIEFPELSRQVMQQGATIIFCPSSTEQKQGMYRVRRCAQARAIENQLYVVETGTLGEMSNVVNMENSTAWAGVFSPCDTHFPIGGVVAEGIEHQDMIIVGEIDLKLIEDVRVSGSVPLIQDRRHDLYTVEFKS